MQSGQDEPRPAESGTLFSTAAELPDHRREDPWRTTARSPTSPSSPLSVRDAAQTSHGAAAPVTPPKAGGLNVNRVNWTFTSDSQPVAPKEEAKEEQAEPASSASSARPPKAKSGAVKEEASTEVRKRAEPEEPPPPPPRKRSQVKQESEVLMMEHLRGYASGSDSISSDESWERTDEAPAYKTACPAEPSKVEKRKLKMKAVIAALEEAAKDDDELAQKLIGLKKKLKKKNKAEDRDVQMEPQEILSILPHLSKEEKRHLYKSLRAEQEEEAFRQLPKEPERRKGYAQPEKEASSSSRAAAAAATSRTDPGELREPPPNLPPVIRKKKVEEFRRGLCNKSMTRKGKLMLSEASDIPSTAEQESCTHEFSMLRWGANGSAHWADCSHCRLRKVLYFSHIHGVLAQGMDETRRPVVMNVILDTGCRTAVAGAKWHSEFQRALIERGLQWATAEHEEVFRFGAGKPVLSTEAQLYPVEIAGMRTWLRLAVVDSTTDSRVADCPALVGPSELARLDVRMDFSAQTISVAGGAWQPLQLSGSRHPVVDVLPGFGLTMKEWETEELRALFEKLRNNPCSMALIQEKLDEIQAAPEKMSSDGEGSASEKEEKQEKPVADDFAQEAAEWQYVLEDEAIQKWDELGLPSEAFRTVSDQRITDEDSSDSEGTISEADSASVSEPGEEEFVEDSSTSESDEDRDLILIADTGGAEEEALTKGQRRRILAATKEIGEAAARECEERKIYKVKSSIPKYVPPRKRWRILEIFTWTCMVSQIAHMRGWEFLEPITLPGWDLTCPKVQKQALEYYERADPDFVVLAWPCGPWSPLQNLNQKTEAQRAALRAKRAQSRRTLLRFTREIALRQRRKGKAVLGENPKPSLAWTTPEILDAFAGCAEAIADQCRYGLKHPTSGLPMKKRTRFMGQPEVVQFLQEKCQGCQEHHPIEGKFQKDGKWYSLSEYAGGYPIPLCTAMIKGAEAYLQRNEAYVEDEESDGYEQSILEDDGKPAVTEGDMIDGEDAIQEEEEFQDVDEEGEQKIEADERHPIPREVAKAVEFAHRQLGHPSRTTLMRMLRLSGATEDAIRYAKRWHCDVCAQRAMPKRPQPAAPSVRPYGFNKHLHIDIKYVLDHNRKKYGCLSMLDLGTCKHDAVMIKSKKSSYVARKFFRHWVSLYGVPEKVTTDQGGEFEKTFTLYMEQMNVTTDVTAAHAGWQLAAGERHGGLLADMLDSIVTEHGLVGFRQMKEGLAAAVAAKNATLTKDGYTPNQRVFGVECKWPSLNDEDPKMSFAEGVSVDSEVSRAHKMRTLARMALIRNDVREKIRRTVLRKAATSQPRPFVPGAQVYFWVPNTQKQTRYRKGGEWRGPATVITREKMKRYFVSWRGRLLLCWPKRISG